MGMRVEDLGELAYGGLVVGAEQWDKRRIEAAELTEKDVFKKFSTYAYLVPGGAATVISAFGPRALRQIEPWAEHVSHGFIYGFPGFLVNTINAMRETGGSANSAKKNAIAEAKRITEQAKRQLEAARSTERTYQPEFEDAQKFAW